MPLAVEGFNCPLLRGTQYAALSAGKKENIVDKDEITNLPKGMTSEELDTLTTGEDAPESVEADKKDEQALAQEALDATFPAEETASTAEEKPEEELTEEQQQLRAKDSKIASQKHELRDSAIENARLQGQLEARKELAKPEEPVKSPLDIAEAEYLEEHDDLVGFTMDGELYRRQRAFDDEQATTKSATKEQQQSNTALEAAAESLQERDLSTEKMGEGLDYQSVSNLGDKYLTRGDLLDLADIKAKRGSSAALKESYNVMRRRILAADNEDSKLLQGAISKSQTKPKKEKTDIDALTTEGDDEVKGETEIGTHNEQLVNFVCG